MSNVINHEDIKYDDNRKQYFLVKRDDDSVKEFLRNNIKEDSSLLKIYYEFIFNSQCEY